MQPYKNYQEVFDKAYAGLKAQGFKQSIKNDECGTCLYTNPEGLHCAVGHLLPEESRENIKHTEYNQKAIGALMRESPIISALFVNINDDFLNSLQFAHDANSTPSIMEKNLRSFALRNNLMVEGAPA